MLVENAIKHNIISNARPLFIDIFVNDELSIVVRNNLQEKDRVVSTKTGLDNIKKRYQFLSKKSVEILSSATNFAVAVPLLDLRQN
jgi:LytS/YehU family sensor histidine kinase